MVGTMTSTSSTELNSRFPLSNKISMTTNFIRQTLQVDGGGGKIISFHRFVCMTLLVRFAQFRHCGFIADCLDSGKFVSIRR